MNTQAVKLVAFGLAFISLVGCSRVTKEIVIDMDFNNGRPSHSQLPEALPREEIPRTLLQERSLSKG